MKSLLKAFLMILLLVLAFYSGTFVSKESVTFFLESFGGSSPLVHVAIYAIGVSLLLPGTIFTAVGAVVFGTFQGYFYNLIGAMLGASLSFCIARWLGKDFIDKVLKNKMPKYDDFLNREGFSAVFYPRLMFVPFSPINFAAGLTKIKFKHFFWGTFLGILPGTFILTFFFDQITSINRFADLLQWEVLFSIALFVFSFFIPFFVKKYNMLQHNA